MDAADDHPRTGKPEPDPDAVRNVDQHAALRDD
jgi:hypothetical protein